VIFAQRSRISAGRPLKITEKKIFRAEPLNYILGGPAGKISGFLPQSAG
jgi:hypothetical protein